MLLAQKQQAANRGSGAGCATGGGKQQPPLGPRVQLPCDSERRCCARHPGCSIAAAAASHLWCFLLTLSGQMHIHRRDDTAAGSLRRDHQQVTVQSGSSPVMPKATRVGVSSDSQPHQKSVYLQGAALEC